MSNLRKLQPRLIRLRDAPFYLGMNKNLFNEKVRPYLTNISIGKQGVAFDRLELDAWVEQYIARNGRPGLAEGEKPWHSLKEAKSGGHVSLHQTDSEYDNLLGLKTNKQHRSMRIGSRQSSGESAN